MKTFCIKTYQQKTAICQKTHDKPQKADRASDFLKYFEGVNQAIVSPTPYPGMC